MSFSNLFSDKNYPNLRSYTLLVAGLIAGSATLNNFFGDGNFSLFGTKKTPSETTSYCWPHNTTLLWEKSPIWVNKNNNVTITTSGTYYLTIDSICTSTGRTSNTTASGGSIETLDSAAVPLLLTSEANYGQLITQIVNKNNRPKIKAEKEFITLNNGETTFTAKNDGFLWFACNHPSFSPYNLPQTKTYNLLMNDSLTYLQLKKKQQEPYFEDNFGQLIITAKVSTE